MSATTSAGLDRVLDHLVAMGAESFPLLKAPFVERRVRIRLRATTSADLGAYADLLDRDPAERRQLLSAVALGVTAFFRDPDAWRELAGRIRALPAGPVAARSAGCSTGEEAWSLALLLADARGTGPTAAWRVTAEDIDPACLTVAREGRYRAGAAADIGRFVPSGPAEAGYRIPDSIRSQVAFEVADLAGRPAAPTFDLALCRNLLMYFHPAGQDRILENVVGSLKPGGLLMLGKAELAPPGWRDRLAVVDRLARIYRRIG
jgi:chemotaxis methyl-accepting protein methylase